MSIVYVTNPSTAPGNLGYDFEALLDDLQFYLGETTFSTWSEDQQKRQLNLAYQEICNQDHWKFTEKEDEDNIVADTALYTLPTDCVGVPYEVRFLNSDRYQKIQKVEFRQYQAMEQTISGNPQYYYVWERQIRLNPTPSTNVTDGLRIRYKYVPDFMEDDDDEPIIPSQYRYIIVTLAAARCFARVKDLKMMNQYMVLYRTELADMRRDLPRVQEEWETKHILDVESEQVAINSYMV